MSADIRPFGVTAQGRAVDLIRLAAGELTVTVLTRGAVVQDVRLAGVPWPLTLGSDQVAAYEGPMRYFGAIVGPVANRIGGASALIGDDRFRFDANEGATTLHGGTEGTHAQVWTVENAAADRVTLRLDLPAGFGGFPGNRVLRADFALEPPAVMTLRLTGSTDAPSLMNLANHSLWSLDGAVDISGHILRVAADHYLPINALTLPVGEIAPVAGTVFDLRNGHTLDLTEDYDHNLCLANSPRPLAFAAELTGRRGVRLTIDTTEPGLQVYGGQTINTGPHIGHAGQPYGFGAGIALEAQRWPDATNHPHFPTVTVRPGADYAQRTRFTFGRA